MTRVSREPIAVVGLACRFPGAEDAQSFWRLLREGRDAITEVPRDRCDLAELYDPDLTTPGNLVTRFGGFVPRIDEFDAKFFRISPREAARMDPQQRLLLELAWEALEDGGQAVDRLAGSPTGVFVGISSYDFGARQLRDPLRADAQSGPGSALSIAANRVSYALDLRGPSIAVDTACSSSLVATHLACCSLWLGESALALAAGVNLIVAPAVTVNFGKAGLLSPDGRCKAFGAAADGYVRSEGGGVIVLKPLARALADDDSIYAVIRGSAVNQDGRSNGLTAPNRFAQEAVLRAALQCADVRPRDVSYVEAHGSGTALGDPIEAAALGSVLSEDRPSGSTCAIGSVKTNIGHLEAAAGIAGLIKVALSLRYAELPPSLHFDPPNPRIPFAHLPLRVQQTLTDWPAQNTPRLAGVSAFGFGGTNAHVVLEQAPEPSANGGAHQDEPVLVPLSARGECALRQLAAAYRETVTTGAAKLTDIAATAANRRAHHDHRLAVAASSPAELADRLYAAASGLSAPGVAVGRRRAARATRLAFVFSGQGSQWPGMARELCRDEPVFHQAFERCEAAFTPFLGRRLLACVGELGASEAWPIDVVQPALFAVQIALAELWRSWGILPDAVVGHSMGEVAAAHAAGALTLADAARVIAERSRLLRRISGRGGMLTTELSTERAQALVADLADRVTIAASNAPRTTVLAGDCSALAAVQARLRREHVFSRIVAVDVAAHSPHVDAIAEDLLVALAGVRPADGTMPFHSTVTARSLRGSELDAGYWLSNLRAPVRFADTVNDMLDAGVDWFVEVSPHPLLTGSLQDIFRDAGRTSAVAVCSLRRHEPERAALLASLGELYAAGAMPDWARVAPRGRCVRLPSYPWQRQRFGLGTEVEDIRGGDGLLVSPGRRLGTVSAPGVLHAPAGRLEATRTRVRALIAEVLRLPASDVGDDVPLRDLGLSSLMATDLRARLELGFGLELSIGFLFAHPTTEALAQAIHERLGATPPRIAADGGGRASADGEVARLLAAGLGAASEGTNDDDGQ